MTQRRLPILQAYIVFAKGKYFVDGGEAWLHGMDCELKLPCARLAYVEAHRARHTGNRIPLCTAITPRKTGPAGLWDKLLPNSALILPLLAPKLHHISLAEDACWRKCQKREVPAQENAISVQDLD